MSGTVVVALPHTSGVTQQDAEKALIDLVERRVRDSLVSVAHESTTLANTARVLAGREIDAEDAVSLLQHIDGTVALLGQKRIEIANRLEALASLIARLDGSPTLELARAG